MIVTAAVLAVGGGSMAFAEIDVTKLPAASTKQGLTFDKDIKPLFEASCVNCHGERRQRAGLRLDSLQATLQGSDEGKVVEAGNGKDSLLVHSISQLDDETAMPPKRGGRGGGGFGGPPGGGGQGGQGGPGGGNRERGGQGGPGGGPGGGGGRGGGFNLAGMMASGLFTQADADKNEKLTKAEFAGLAGTWFDKIDTKKAGKLTQEELSGGMEEVLPAINPFGGGGGGGQRGPGAGRGPGGQRGGNEGMGFGIGRMVGPAFFTAGDADKDGALTRAELSETFGKWYSSWDTNKTDALTEPQFRDGFAASMPRGGGGRGPGGPGGGAFAGFGFGRTALAQQMITQGDADKNEKLSKGEFMAMADIWFDKVDATKAGKVNQEQFTAKLAEALGMPPEAAPAAPQAGAHNGEGGPGRGGGLRPDAGGPGGLRGGGGGGVSSMGPGLFSAVDGDKDGSLTRAELKATFEKWLASFDTAKSGSLDNDSLYAGLREVIPQGGFGGMGGGFPGRRGGDAPAKPLTAEQVGLVRAWIDQGAK